MDDIDPLEVTQCERKEVTECDLCSIPWLFVLGADEAGGRYGGGRKTYDINNYKNGQRGSDAALSSSSTKELAHAIATRRGVAFAQGSRDGELLAMRDFDRRVQSTNYHSGSYHDVTPVADSESDGGDEDGDNDGGSDGGDGDSGRDEDEDADSTPDETGLTQAMDDDLNQLNEAASFNAWFHRIVQRQENVCLIQTYFEKLVVEASNARAKTVNTGRGDSNSRNSSNLVRGVMMLESANVKAVEWLRKTFPCAQIVVDDRHVPSVATRSELWAFHHKVQHWDHTYLVSSTPYGAQQAMAGDGGGARANLSHGALSHLLAWLGEPEMRQRRDSPDNNQRAGAADAGESSTGGQPQRRRSIATPMHASAEPSVFDGKLADAVQGKCSVCEDDWVIVVGTGRSGSTTVLEMLNSIPGVLINGEHNGQLWALLSALNHATRGLHGVESVDFVSVFGNYSNLGTSESLKQAREHMQLVHAMRGAAAAGEAAQELNAHKERFLCYVRWYIRHMLSVDCTKGGLRGFKEVRYATPPMLAFLRDLFPCGKFILNYRDPVSQSHSSWWVRHLREDREGTMRELNGMVNTLLDFHAQHKGAGVQRPRDAHGDNAYNNTAEITSFEDGFGAPTQNTFLLPLESFSVDTFNRMLKWLGKTGCKFNHVLHSNWHSGMHMDLRKVIEC